MTLDKKSSTNCTIDNGFFAKYFLSECHSVLGKEKVVVTVPGNGDRACDECTL